MPLQIVRNDIAKMCVDAIGGAHKHAREEGRPERTLLVATTDGMENAGRLPKPCLGRRPQDVDKVNRLPERCQSPQDKEANLQTRFLTWT